MRIECQPSTYKNKQPPKNFRGLSELVMDNVFLNKALFDLTGSDIPWVVMANNKEERRERINRASLSVGLIFLSPFVILPFASRFAMNKITKLTPKLFSSNYNAIRLSNKYLVSAEKTKEGLEKLAKEKTLSNELRNLYYKGIKRKPIPEEKIDLPELLKSVNGDYDKLRTKISTAKNLILGIDLLIVSGTFGHIGFFNNKQTEKKTGQIGYSAEIKMAEKEVIEGRAAKYKRNERLRYFGFLTVLAGLSVGLPLAIRHGVTTKKTSLINNFIKKHSEKFDYIDVLFMKRLPLFLSFLGAQCGIFMASRNKTERKDNAIRGSNVLAIFFLGDLLLASLLGRASDSIAKTKIIKHDNKKSWLNKILPPMKELEELKATKCPKTMKNAKIIFWSNFTFLSLMMGIITPYIINKIIKKDVQQDVDKISNIK